MPSQQELETCRIDILNDAHQNTQVLLIFQDATDQNGMWHTIDECFSLLSCIALDVE